MPVIAQSPLVVSFLLGLGLCLAAQGNLSVPCFQGLQPPDLLWLMQMFTGRGCQNLSVCRVNFSVCAFQPHWWYSHRKQGLALEASGVDLQSRLVDTGSPLHQESHGQVSMETGHRATKRLLKRTQGFLNLVSITYPFDQSSQKHQSLASYEPCRYRDPP